MFEPGERVKPRPGFNTSVTLAAGVLPPLPTGTIETTVKYGKGQVVRVRDDTGTLHPWECSGAFMGINEELPPDPPPAPQPAPQAQPQTSKDPQGEMF